MLPEWLVLDLRMMYAAFQQHGLVASAADLDAVRKLLGREPRRFEVFVAEVAPGWKR